LQDSQTHHAAFSAPLFRVSNYAERPGRLVAFSPKLLLNAKVVLANHPA
jgi:hypothetical protein